MSIPLELKDGRGSTSLAKVSEIGEVAVSPYAYSESKYVELAAINTAYNFFKPKVGKQFVITGMYLKADQQVSNTVDADVVIYEATASDTTTVSDVLFQTAMVRDDSLPLTPLNIVVTEGYFVNGKTTDDDIHATIMGYYIPVLEND